MSVADDLDRFRESLTGCDLIVLADLDTGTVLASSADLAPTQERLDALTAEASAMIVGPIGEGAAILLEGDPPTPELAVLSHGDRTHVFVAPPTRGTEALLVSLQPGAPLDRIFDCAADTLADILSNT